jgi:hypothetical protein
LASAEVTPNPPTVQEFAEKITELVHLERGIAALYYYLPDDTLAAHAQMLCQQQQARHLTEAGVDREMHRKYAAFEEWQAVGALWCSEGWQPGELLATFGYRLIEALRPQHEAWSVIVDPRAQFYGLAGAKDDQGHYWLALVIGQKGTGGGLETATAAR